MPSGARAPAGLGVHPRPEVCEALLGDSLVSAGNRTCVLLKAVKQNEEVAGPLVKKAVSGVREPNSELAHATLDLRGDRKLGRGIVGVAAVEVLLHERVDLRHGARLGDEQVLEPVVDRLSSVGIPVVDGLRPPTVTGTRRDVNLLRWSLGKRHRRPPSWWKSGHRTRRTQLRPAPAAFRTRATRGSLVGCDVGLDRRGHSDTVR